MLFWALLASGQITMRKVDRWQTLAHAPQDAIPLEVAVSQRQIRSRQRRADQAISTLLDGTSDRAITVRLSEVSRYFTKCLSS